MPKEIEFKFKCDICGKVHSGKTREVAEQKARDCEQSHDIVYIPMLKSDVQRLLAFIVSKEDGLITDTLWRTLRRYRTLK